MGDRARADPDAARPQPRGSAGRYRRRSGELRPPDAVDRAARRRFLEVAVVYHDGLPTTSRECAPEAQVSRLAAFTLGLRAIARHGVVGPWRQPVGHALGE